MISLVIKSILFTLSILKYTIYAAHRFLLENGFQISEITVIREFRKIKKRGKSYLAECSVKPKRKRPVTENKSYIEKVRKFIERKKPKGQRWIADHLGISRDSVQIIIHEKLKAKAVKTSCLQYLKPDHITQRKTRCRLMYENYLSGNKYQNIITLDEKIFELQNYQFCSPLIKKFCCRVFLTNPLLLYSMD